MAGSSKQKLVLGWREWASLPELKIEKIKVKVDTGARTSALHAFNIRLVKKQGKDYVHFDVHPLQQNEALVKPCTGLVRDYRWVTDSGGNREKRFVIETPIRIGSEEWPIEITLTGRDQMRFRMLLGRNAVKNKFLVDPGLSHRTRKADRPKPLPAFIRALTRRKAADEEE